MARSPDVLDDPTPLDSPRVDVRVRVAWLLRMSRAAGVDGVALSVTEMARRLKDLGISASAPSVSGWETGRVAPGTGVLEAYEAVLGREPGHPAQRRRRGPPQSGHDRSGPLPRTSEAGRPRPGRPTAVMGSRRATGLDWLHFCEAALAVRPGLPRRLMRRPDRPPRERGRPARCSPRTSPATRPSRSSGAASTARWSSTRSATTSTSPASRSSPRPWAWSPSAPTGPACASCVPHLTSEDPVMMRGAAVGLRNLASVGGLSPADWDHVVAPFVAAFNAHADDERQRRLLSNLWRALPSSVRTGHPAGPRVPGGPGAPDLGRRPARAPRGLLRRHRHQGLRRRRDPAPASPGPPAVRGRLRPPW